MTSAPSPLVKICGVTRREDAECAVRSGASFVGVILAPGGKRTIARDRAADLLDGIDARRVGVFVDASVDEMVAAALAIGLDVLQLHGSEAPEAAAELRAAGPWSVWKALRPRTADDFAHDAARYADPASVDGILLDGWSPDAPGGTGARFPWEAIARRRAVLPTEIALIAAGGLNPSNVSEAVRLLRPDVVDVSSGVERSPGIKDHDAVLGFVHAARSSLPGF